MVGFVFLVLALAAGFGWLWLRLVYLPRRKRQRAEAWLEAAGDEAAIGVATYTRAKTRGSGSRRKRTEYTGAKVALRPPWSDLCVALGEPRRMPDSPAPVSVEDPREVEAVWMWVGDPDAYARLSDPELARGFRAFLRVDGRRSIRDGEVRAEGLSSEVDALGLAALQSDVADVLHLLEQA